MANPCPETPQACGEASGSKRALPAGWRWVRLGDIAEVVNGFGFAEHLQGRRDLPFPFIKVSDMNAEGAETVVRRAANTVGDEILKALRARTYPAGTVIFPKVGGALLTNKKRILGVEASFDNNIMGVVPKDVDSSWLFRWIQTVDLRSLANTQALPSIRQSEVAELHVPLPPLPEQQRIAAILTGQMAAVERARAAAEARLEAAQALPAAYLRAVFDSPEAREWPRKPLGEVGAIVSGVTLGRKLKDGKTREVPYLRVANVKDGHLDLSDVYRIAATAEEIQKLRLKFGDLLLTEGGDPDKLGRGSFWAEQLPECIHQNHIFRVRFDLGVVSPEFVTAQVGSAYGKAYFLAHAKQTTGIATINQKVLAAFPLMLPALPDQKLVAQNLAERMQALEAASKAAEAELTAINALPAALLRRAFSGGL